VLKLSSNESEVLPRVHKLSSEGSERKPLVLGGGDGVGAGERVPRPPAHGGASISVALFIEYGCITGVSGMHSGVYLGCIRDAFGGIGGVSGVF
jgi:hypothetical protein